MRRPLLVALLLVLGACGDGGATTSAVTQQSSEDVIAVRASTDLAVGEERLLLALAGVDGTRLGSPDLGMTITLWPEGEPGARQEVTATWMWAIPDRSGLYRATVNFDRAGVWIAEMVPESGPTPSAVPVLVQESSRTPAIGAQAPPSSSPTASSEEGIDAISSDTSPDPRLYAVSIADAVGSGRASVITFATPQFCQTAICGPTLETVKELIDRYPAVNFVHVEVFDLEASPPGATSLEDLVVAPSVLEWGLTSEPWVFVVDAAGTVTGRFEGVVDPVEIEALLG